LFRRGVSSGYWEEFEGGGKGSHANLDMIMGL
jgi:hypothetical protein